MLTGPYSYTSPVMYATAIMPSVTEPTGTPILTEVAIVLVVAVVACAGLLLYFRKHNRKTDR